MASGFGQRKAPADRKNEEKVKQLDHVEDSLDNVQNTIEITAGELLAGQSTIKHQLDNQKADMNLKHEELMKQLEHRKNTPEDTGGERVSQMSTTNVTYNINIEGNTQMIVGNQGSLQNVDQRSVTDQQDAGSQSTQTGEHSQSTVKNTTTGAGNREEGTFTKPIGAREKMSTEEPLKNLWAIPSFQDELCHALNIKYESEIKNWRDLADKFLIHPDIFNKFPSLDSVSPTETMFQHLEIKQPYLTVENLCEALKEAKAYQVLRIVEKAIQENKVLNDHLVSDMWDDAPEELEQVILNLDKGVWKDVAIALGFKKKKDLESLKRNLTSNPTRTLFNILRTQKPNFKVHDFKEKLKLESIGHVLKILEDSRISDQLLLAKLCDNAKVMPGIEHVLNNPKDKGQSLWKLAESLKNDGTISSDVDIEIFKHQEIEASPTYHLIEHVIARCPEEQTIGDLIQHLSSINRNDCTQGIIAYYLKGGGRDVENIRQKMEQLQCSPTLERNDAVQSVDTSD